MVRVVADAVNARVLDAPPNIHLELYNLLSYMVEGYEHSKAFRARRWDGKASFYSANTGSFPAGFFDVVIAHLRKIGQTIQVSRVPAPAPLGPPIDKCILKTGHLPHPRYAYQAKVAEELVKRRQMIAQVATGGGKTNIAALSFWRIGRPTLFLTTRGVLMNQMKETMEKLGETIGVIGESIWEPNFNGMTVGMVQTIAPRLLSFDIKGEAEKIKMVQAVGKDGKPRVDRRGRPKLVQSPAYKSAIKAGPAAVAAYERNIKDRLLQLAQEHHTRRDRAVATLQRFELVILEEAHEVGSDSYYKILKACTNAHYRLALTATPFMRSSDEASMRLMAASGPVGYRVPEKLLIDSGILARPIFKIIDDVPRPPALADGMTWAEVQNVALVDHQARNERVCFEAQRAVAHGLSVLVLINRKRHGHLLQSMFSALGITSKFIYGASDKGERARGLADLASGAISVLIGSSILDIGVDVPSLGMVILAGGGKAEEAARQRIGRGLRAKKSGPNVALIVDFADQHNDYTKNHALERLRVIVETPGFVEGLLLPMQDFDFSIFAKKAA